MFGLGLHIWEPSNSPFPGVAITFPASGSAFLIGSMGALGGTVSPSGRPVEVWGGTVVGPVALLGVGLTIGATWVFEWTPTVADWGVTHLYPKSGSTLGAGLPITVYGMPEVIFGANLIHWYDDRGLTADGSGNVLSEHDYGTAAKDMLPDTALTSPAISTDPAYFAGMAHTWFTDLNDNDKRTRTTGAPDVAQPCVSIWHGLLTGPDAAGKVIFDGESNTNYATLSRSSGSSGQLLRIGQGATAADTNRSSIIEETALFYADGANSHCDTAAVGAVAFTASPVVTVGVGALRGFTSNRRASGYTGAGRRDWMRGRYSGIPTALELQRFLALRNFRRSGGAFVIGGGWVTFGGLPVTFGGSGVTYSG